VSVERIARGALYCIDNHHAGTPCDCDQAENLRAFLAPTPPRPVCWCGRTFHGWHKPSEENRMIREDYPSRVEAVKAQKEIALLRSKLEGTAQLFEDLLTGVRAFVRDRGRHDGPHFRITPPSFQGPTISSCSECELAYMKAERDLDICVGNAVAALEPDE
jgi:hypothetical protein